MVIRVLCTGDIHIGRSASKIPESYRCSQAWTAIVDRAIAERVDLLAISGDVIDKESKSYESIGPLQDGLRRLNEAEIDTVAIAGNHDFDVLTRLATITGTDRFHLLGKGGTWERFTLQRDGAARLHVDGWSFPKEHVRENPMHEYRAYPDDGIPVLALLHADVGNLRSHYGPVVVDDLWARRVDFWLLGHIHDSRQFSTPTGPIALYPGSPYAMDPGESKAHGVWIVTFDANHPLAPEFIPLSPVRYDSVAVDLTQVVDESGFQSAITGALLRAGQSALADHGDSPLRVVSCRLRLVGSCAAHHWIPAWAEKARSDIGTFPVGSVTIRIDEFALEVRPPVDLELLSIGNDPVSETARLLLALNAPELPPPYADLVRRLAADMTGVYRHSGYAGLIPNEQLEMINGPSEDDARALLISQGWNFLSALISQREYA